MKVDVLEKEAVAQKTVQLIDGTFTPSETSDLVSSLIEEKINFHKIQRLQQWEGNHHANSNHLEERIVALEQEKADAKEFIAEYRATGKKLTVRGIIEISIEE